MSTLNSCAHCRAPRASFTCQDCRVATYCGQPCQQKHWTEGNHSKECPLLASKLKRTRSSQEEEEPTKKKKEAAVVGLNTPDSVPVVSATILGQGSYGKVYKVTLENEKVYAVKKIPVDKFDQHEVDILTQLSATEECNQYVVCLVKHTKGEEYVYLWFEYLDGVDMYEYYNQTTAVDSQFLISFMQQLIQGVMYLHNNQIAHKDLKPENVFITRDGRVKIMDFGFSCSGVGDCGKSDPKGTFEYVPSSMWRLIFAEKSIGLDDYKKQDVYALGQIVDTVLDYGIKKTEVVEWATSREEQVKWWCTPFERNHVYLSIYNQLKPVSERRKVLVEFMVDVITEKLTTVNEL